MTKGNWLSPLRQNGSFRHCEERSDEAIQGGAAPLSASGLHHGEQAQRYALHRRDLGSAQTRLGASGRRGGGLLEAIRVQAAGLVRSPLDDGLRDHPREADQGGLSKKEDHLDRSDEPAMEGSLPRHLRLIALDCFVATLLAMTKFHLSLVFARGR